MCRPSQEPLGVGAAGTHNCHPGGGGGHDGSGFQSADGVHPGATGGQPGGGLKRY
jgi:hypothetical protein